MNDKQQGVLAVALIAFFILVVIAVNTLALSNTPFVQPQCQQEIAVDNETASDSTSAINGSNSTE
ncbi:hypothetical protein YTPLAS21_03220 [Candidatus Nitrosocosmicus sp.]|nr:hypothetical protein YTPLAS21_03220 [Candidatus Nitrosocosmicus sp.]